MRGVVGSVDSGVVVDMWEKRVGSFILRWGFIEVDASVVSNEIFIEPNLAEETGAPRFLNLLTHLESARHAADEFIL